MPVQEDTRGQTPSGTRDANGVKRPTSGRARQAEAWTTNRSISGRKRMGIMGMSRFVTLFGRAPGKQRMARRVRNPGVDSSGGFLTFFIGLDGWEATRCYLMLPKEAT